MSDDRKVLRQRRWSREAYQRNKYNKGKVCLLCLLLEGKLRPVNNKSTLWCCVKHAKQVSWFIKSNPGLVQAIIDAAPIEGGRRTYNLPVHALLREEW